ncbi:MAG TPA: hypothetical protein VK208_13010, partial [Pyrinomonadaceae bacterium]|nr:hypothetical protein [Pyrinomonadaceae bacterium]
MTLKGASTLASLFIFERSEARPQKSRTAGATGPDPMKGIQHSAFSTQQSAVGSPIHSSRNPSQPFLRIFASSE